mgnify:CR=1 FL=1
MKRKSDLYRFAINGCILILQMFFSVGLMAQSDAVKINPTNYFIVVTGGELLEGVYPDSHTSFIARSLLKLGLRCVGSMIVDDNRNDIISALSYATNKTSLIIVTGGLGPTANDITRETLSEFTKIELRENQQLIEQIVRRFNVKRENLKQNLIKQTLIPVKGGYLKSSSGTAAGLVFDMDRCQIIALPGPPSELQQMVNEELLPFLQNKYGIHPLNNSITVKFVGIGQSQIDDTLRNKIKIDSDIIMTSIFEGSRVDFTFSLPGSTQQDITRLQQVVQKLKEYFGDAIYSTNGESFESVVASHLKGYKLRFADACGACYKIHISDGFRELVDGCYSAPDFERLKKIIGIPEEDWKGLNSVKDKANYIATYLSKNPKNSLAICAGEPIKSDSSYVIWIAIKTADYNESFSLNLRDLSERNLTFITTQILDHLRRHFK